MPYAITGNYVTRSRGPSSFLIAPGLPVVKNSVSGNWLAVDHRDGSLCSVDSSAPWAQRVFRLIQLSQPQDNSPLHFGDDVWISSSAGTHAMRWRNGKVIGTHTRTAHNMMTGVSDTGAPKGRFKTIQKKSRMSYRMRCGRVLHVAVSVCGQPAS